MNICTPSLRFLHVSTQHRTDVSVLSLPSKSAAKVVVPTLRNGAVELTYAVALSTMSSTDTRTPNKPSFANTW